MQNKQFGYWIVKSCKDNMCPISLSYIQRSSSSLQHMCFCQLCPPALGTKMPCLSRSVSLNHLWPPPKNAIASTVELATTMSSLSSDISCFSIQCLHSIYLYLSHIQVKNVCLPGIQCHNAVIPMLFAGLFHAHPGERHTAHPLSPFYLLISKH